MDSDKIKAIVLQTKGLLQGEQEPTDLMTAMTRDMAKSPHLAIGLIEHLRASGIDLFSTEGTGAQEFRDTFESKMADLSEREFTQIRKITARWFT